MERRLWSQVVAVAWGVPANVVAVWSQSGLSDSAGIPIAGPMSCRFGARREGFEPPTARSVAW